MTGRGIARELSLSRRPVSVLNLLALAQSASHSGFRMLFGFSYSIIIVFGFPYIMFGIMYTVFGFLYIVSLSVLCLGTSPSLFQLCESALNGR